MASFKGDNRFTKQGVRNLNSKSYNANKVKPSEDRQERAKKLESHKIPCPVCKGTGSDVSRYPIRGCATCYGDGMVLSSKPLDPRYSLDASMKYDLIYTDGDEVRKEILDQFPQAKLTGEYDYIHENRLSVEIENTTIKDWFKFLITSGLSVVSFLFQFQLLDNIKAIHGLLNEMSDG